MTFKPGVKLDPKRVNDQRKKPYPKGGGVKRKK